MQLLQFLRSKNTDRFTKVDAFCDLMARMTAYPKPQDGKQQEPFSPLGYGRFTGSISELAQDWHWHRATVRGFLDGLERQGYLKRQLDGRNYIFQLRTRATVSVPVSSNETLRDVGFFLLRHCEEYAVPVQQLATYFEEYYHLVVDGYEGSDLNTDLAAHKADTILQAFFHLQLTRVKPFEAETPMVQMISSTLQGTDPWTWEKWIKALVYLDRALPGADFPDLATLDKEGQHPLSMSEFTELDMRLLRELFYYVKPYCDAEPKVPHGHKAEDSSSSLSSIENERF